MFALTLELPPPPVDDMVIVPGPFVMLIFAPAVMVARLNPVPLPMSNLPLVGVAFDPVPPADTPSTPLIVMLPVEVTGPPVKVRPVVPPFTSTLVTAVDAALSHENELPVHFRKVLELTGAVMKLVALEAVWKTIWFPAPP